MVFLRGKVAKFALICVVCDTWCWNFKYSRTYYNITNVALKARLSCKTSFTSRPVNNIFASIRNKMDVTWFKAADLELISVGIIYRGALVLEFNFLCAHTINQKLPILVKTISLDDKQGIYDWVHDPRVVPYTQSDYPPCLSLTAPKSGKLRSIKRPDVVTFTFLVLVQEGKSPRVKMDVLFVNVFALLCSWNVPVMFYCFIRALGFCWSKVSWELHLPRKTRR